MSPVVAGIPMCASFDSGAWLAGPCIHGLGEPSRARECVARRAALPFLESLIAETGADADLIRRMKQAGGMERC